jgi:hypothetical protein
MTITHHRGANLMNDRLTQLAADQAAALQAQDVAAHELAELILESDVDHLELLGKLQGNVALNFWASLTAALEVCPVHICDEQICRDDMADCPAGIETVEAYEAEQAEEETKKWAAMLLWLQEAHPAAAKLVEQGWTVEAALAHVEGSCDLELCTHPSHAELAR